jgi:hypothetical protein
MILSTGYYSLIQYCPEPSRLESANVGVLLFSPKHCFLKAITAHDNRRIRQFFGSEGHDWVRLNSFKQAIEERVRAESHEIKSVEDLQSFISRRANRLRITDPRPMRVADPEKDLLGLFKDLVGGEQRRQSSGGFKSYLRRRFWDAGLQAKLRTDIVVTIPSFKNRQLSVPYGYQNGRFRLILPARFSAENPDNVIPTACRYAVSGESLYENQDKRFGKLELVVVGVFPPKHPKNVALVRGILEKHKVRLYSANNVDSLIQDIKDNARDISGKP